MKYKLLLRIFPAIVFLALQSCDGEDDSSRISDAPDLSGEWQLSGEGRQSGCASEQDNVNYGLSLSEPFDIEATLTSEADELSVWQLTLLNEDDLDDINNFTGQAGRADRIVFSFDVSDESGNISFSFDGNINSETSASGGYSAIGPGDCMTVNEGANFSLSIE